MNEPISGVKFSTLLLVLHVYLEERINSFPLFGKDMLDTMAKVAVGRQIQVTSLMGKRLFGSFDHTCVAVSALRSQSIQKITLHAPSSSLKTNAGSARRRMRNKSATDGWQARPTKVLRQVLGEMRPILFEEHIIRDQLFLGVPRDVHGFLNIPF
jgi:hypothetical protein